MTLTIWVDDWQIQCCGEAFALGDVVSWNLLEVDPEDYAGVVGKVRATGIDFREEHHGQEGDQTTTLLEVLTITEVHCRYAVPPDSTCYGDALETRFVDDKVDAMESNTEGNTKGNG
ncbi:DUF6578 domain-containing protein [Streptomyces sp. NPDC002755]|uniref:DUF6578 domain-containing protein n=1 Tax=Streptomyces sp. NPDC002884 TaxID=3154544 RepID=UPI003316DBA7